MSVCQSIYAKTGGGLLTMLGLKKKKTVKKRISKKKSSKRKVSKKKSSKRKGSKN